MKKRRSAFDGAADKGRQAFRDGIPLEANPYPDWRTNNGRNSVTFSRGFWTAWRRGWQEAESLAKGK